MEAETPLHPPTPSSPGAGGAGEFDSLTQEEQIAKLELLGRAALAQFGVAPLQITSLAHAENTTYKVDAEEGSYCLRIHRPGYQDPESIRSELQWLHALRHETDLEVPDPKESRTGELLVEASYEDMPARSCVLFRWMDGEFRKQNSTPSDMHAIGRLMARLHEHAEQWDRPSSFIRHILDQDNAYAEGTDSALECPHAFLADEDRAWVLAQARECRSVMHQLGKSPDVYGLIHADLHQGNVLFEGTRVKAIDFDDCGFAHHLYDFAAALAFRSHNEDFNSFRDQIFAGYETVRSLPPHTRELLPTFLSLRFYGVIRWVLSRDDNPWLRENGGEFAQWLLAGMKKVGHK